MVVRVVGIGQRAGGDDGVGPAVVDRLRGEAWSADVELCEVAEPSALMPLLEGARRVVVIDAALGSAPPGEVLVVQPNQVDPAALSPVSTHGMSVGQAIALANILSAETVCHDIVLVAVVAERPKEIAYGLSERVAAAVPRAAEVARSLALEALAS